MLLNLLSHSDRARWAPAVWSLADRGTLGAEIERMGIPVAAAGLRRRWPSPAAAWRARTQLQRAAPDILLGWMYHGNFAAWAARRSFRRSPTLIWNIQHTPDELASEKWTTAALIALSARLSRSVTSVIYCSRVSATLHAELGYDTARSRVIPNGFNTDQFKPDRAARAAWRARLGVDDATVLVGRIGRYHPMKDHTTFLGAAAVLRRERRHVRFVVAGRGTDRQNAALLAQARRLGIGDVVTFVGEVRPTHELTAALDVACSSSAYGEALPGVLGEAMSCGVPCVSTDVGDSSWVVGDTGTLVPPRDPAALAGAMRTLVDLGAEGRGRLGESARDRVRSHFSIQRVAGMYDAVLEEAVATTPAADTPQPSALPSSAR